jgi:hypothetical protein
LAIRLFIFLPLHGPERFSRIGDLDQLAGGGFRIRLGAIGGEFHQPVPILAGAK